ncbi:hypothetical protein [Bradyrhizobium sp. CER78]|uniref:beta strand repeat-containing protein n=1 Tax=Bradyrhizobium sp. CER78 TaxID=3039162 RepID=UPI002449662C|nr:hypothetical protein [Bradyrhizobium sp. CER78]MDH2381897.1 hypothetical protein [Bradyrhizobium sp. CER78]
MAGYTYTTILSSYQTSGYYQLTGFNNADVALFSFGGVYANGVLTTVAAPSGQTTQSGIYLNNAGEVIGTVSQQSNDPYFIGYVGSSPAASDFSPTIPPNAPNPPNGYSNFTYAYAVNDSGTILGAFRDDAGFFPFLYSNGATTLLTPLFNRSAVALNNSDQIVGDYTDSSNISHGFFYDPNAVNPTVVTVDDPAASTGNNTYLMSINNAGQILGRFTSNTSATYFLDTGGNFVSIVDPNATAGTTVATSMNNSGEVVGYYQTAGVYHGFTYLNGVYTTIDEPGAAQTASQSANGTFLERVNDAGDLIGIYYDSAVNLYGTHGVPHYFTATVYRAPPTLAVNSIASATAGQAINLSSLVTISDPSNLGYQSLQLWDSNGTAAGGEFLINGTPQTGGHAITVPSGATVVFDAGTGSGTDTLWAQLIQKDGTTTGWQPFTVTVAAPTFSTMSVSNATAGAQIALSNLVTVSDPSNATYQLQLWDLNGSAAGGEFLINGAPQTGGHAITVPSGATVAFDAGTGSGTDTLWAQLIQSDGTPSGWKPFTVTVAAPTFSTMNVSNATAGAQIALSSLVTVSDPSNATYQLQLWDSNGSAAGGEFLINGTPQTGGHAITVPSGATVAFDAGTGPGTDTLWAQLIQSNGTPSGWQAFTVTVPAPTLSTASVSNATAGAQIALSNLVTVSDPSNATYQLQLWDSNGSAAGGEFLINGTPQTGGHAITVPSGATVVFDAGTGAGTDTLWAQLIQSNGTPSGWRQFSVTVPTPTLSTTSVSRATAGAQIALSNLVTVSDPSNATYQLQLWDSNGSAAGGEFLINGTPQTGGHAINVPSGATVVFDAGTGAGTDTLWAQLVESNGTTSGWQQFSVTVPNPTVAVHNYTTATPGQTIALSNLVTISDPGNVGYQKLELWDSDGTAATGQFVVNNVTQTGGHAIDVSPANVGNVVFNEGTTGNTDTLWAQLILNNGTATGWQSFTVVDPVTIAQGTTVELANAYAGHAIFAGDAGTLQIDHFAGFSGTVAGMSGTDTLDLRDIGFGSTTKASYSGDGSQGTLSITDGANTAQIALLGNYMASTFAVSSDGHGGSSVQVQPNLVTTLAPPQHA